MNTHGLNNTAVSRSIESIQLKKYYYRTSRRLKSRGLLRTDLGEADSPYTSKNLIENFEKIALYDEYIIKNGKFISEETESKIKRWETAIKINVIHGKTNSRHQIKIDKKNIANFSKRLSSLTGLSIENNKGESNFIILFLDFDEQRNFGEKLKELMPQLTPAMIKAITSSPRTTFCSAFALSKPSNAYEYTAAIILIKSEHSQFMRKSCIHEEMAQSLGLSNDSKVARPSIFNDDEEFSLLTTHDENLLRILYDSRLKPGMNNKDARPIVTKIVKELLNF
jgi:hypothetical protein